MKTAALLPTPGDPYRALYWLRHFESWRDKVDELRVFSSGQHNLVAREVIREAVEGVGGVYDERDDLVPHGIALGILVQDCDADVVMLCEDDAFVRQPSAVAETLAFLRSGDVDVVASPRQSMTPELADAAVRRWGECSVPHDGATGHGMWPAFVFARRDALLATDRNFSNWSWGTGQRVPGLDHVVVGPTAVVDTFGSAAFQLREHFRVCDVPQFKGPWRWEEWLDAGVEMPWFHAGSLSSSANLLAETPEFMDGRTMTTDQEVGEWSHRLSWWLRMFETTYQAMPDDANERYMKNFQRLADRVGINREQMRVWDDVVDRMVTWDEYA